MPINNYTRKATAIQFSGTNGLDCCEQFSSLKYVYTKDDGWRLMDWDYAIKPGEWIVRDTGMISLTVMSDKTFRETYTPYKEVGADLQAILEQTCRFGKNYWED